ncbi:cyclic nucleotide-binding domain-containing protein 1 [Rhineura floridana]|uniref:cyclic nucleotide-binding domain-containing protein 1 n=1 Tax=Rhineura floridana TaxID=261503 RepID=UPI002AC82E3B|nr:cyclic nucleotide-binding domain-containing protein 1 [Rhineura floridana]
MHNEDETLLPFFKICDELSLHNGLVICGTHRLIAPPGLQAKLIQLAHETHQGIVRTKQRLCDLYWWPGMDKQVEDTIKSCVTCQHHDKTAITHVPPLQPVPLPDSAWEKLAIDIVGPFKRAPADCRYAITLIDYFSEWPEVAFTSHATSAAVITFLSAVFSQEGDPMELISDNGTQFTSVEFETFLSERNICHRRSSIYYPQANGEIERFNRSLKQSLQMAELEDFLQVYRSTRHATTQKFPAELLHGREMCTKLKVAGLLVPKSDASLQPGMKQIVHQKQQKYKRDNPYTTKEAHQKFMEIYPKIFTKEKAMLPGIPEKRTKGIHSCDFSKDTITGEDSHNIAFYINQIKKCQKLRSGSPEFIEKLQILTKILKKIPILRSPEEHETVFKTMKVIPDISEQLSDAEMRHLCTTVIREFWVKGSTVDGSQAFYAILKGSVRTLTKYYKKMIGGGFVSGHVQWTSSSELSPSAPQMLFGIGTCFGTLVPLPPKMHHNVLTIVTEENCDFLKISSTDYLRVKEELGKREQLAKEELIRGCPYYQNWPMVFIFQLTAQLKWRKFPIDHVFMKGGEISQYVGFIKSGCCNAYRIIPALVKRPLGKMIKRMKQVLIGQLCSRESFGEVSILLQIPSTYTLKAATPVELGIIDATDILGLDPVIQMLLLQTVKPSFENITYDDLKLEYIKKEGEKEWKHKKDMILQDVLSYNGIIPGAGKWVHELLISDKGERKHEEDSHIATYRRPV